MFTSYYNHASTEDGHEMLICYSPYMPNDGLQKGENFHDDNLPKIAITMVKDKMSDHTPPLL